MSYAALAESIHVYINTGAQAASSTAHPSMRPAGTATPIAVYEYSADTVMYFPGIFGAKPQWAVQASIACIADTVQGATSLASDLADFINANPTYVCPNTGLELKCTELSFALSSEQPDDGQQDAERTVTVTATIQAREP